MLNMIGRRLAIAIPLLLLVSFLVFALTALSPADPAEAILGEGASPASLKALRNQLGLDDSLLHRYGSWLSELFHGSLGRSWFSNEPVTTKIAQTLPITVWLVVAAVVLTAVVAIPLGLYTAMRPGSAVDRAVGVLSGLFLAMPEFWVALLLILVLSVHLHWLPGTGATEITPNVWDDAHHLILPVVAIALPQICALYRQTRVAAGSVARQDFVRTARAGGIRESSLLWTHVAKNALVPSVTLLGLQLGRMVGISAVVESVYGMRGIGSLAVQAALSSDLPIVLGVVLITAALVMASNLLADIATHLLAPKARHA